MNCGTLIVHGTDDWLTPPADITRLAGAFSTPPDRIEVPGAGHSNVIGTGGAELLRRIAEFLDGADDAPNLAGEDASTLPRAVP